MTVFSPPAGGWPRLLTPEQVAAMLAAQTSGAQAGQTTQSILRELMRAGVVPGVNPTWAARQAGMSAQAIGTAGAGALGGLGVPSGATSAPVAAGPGNFVSSLLGMQAPAATGLGALQPAGTALGTGGAEVAVSTATRGAVPALAGMDATVAGLTKLGETGDLGKLLSKIADLSAKSGSPEELQKLLGGISQTSAQAAGMTGAQKTMEAVAKAAAKAVAKMAKGGDPQKLLAGVAKVAAAGEGGAAKTGLAALAGSKAGKFVGAMAIPVILSLLLSQIFKSGLPNWTGMGFEGTEALGGRMSKLQAEHEMNMQELAMPSEQELITTALMPGLQAQAQASTQAALGMGANPSKYDMGWE